MARKPQGAFAALVSLKGRPRTAAAAPPRPAPADAPPAPTPEDDKAFRDALQGVRPLRGSARAELTRPKPAPIPRPQPPASIEPAPPTRRAPPKDDASLFQAEMADVHRLRHANRVEFDTHHHRAHAADGLSGALPDTPFPLPDLNDPAQLFRHAVRGTQGLRENGRAELDLPRPQPAPIKREEDERQALADALATPLSFEDRLDMGDEAAFLRPGLPRRVLTDLRRGRWVLQGEIDLHGLNRDEAREALGRFLAASLREGRRCVRVIHGKGLRSPGKESILKQLSRAWLAQREEILAFCQPRPHDGGAGALLVLLAAPRGRQAS